MDSNFCSKVYVADETVLWQDVFMLPEDVVLDAATIAEIIRRGYSRIPIYAVSLLVFVDIWLPVLETFVTPPVQFGGIVHYEEVNIYNHSEET